MKKYIVAALAAVLFAPSAAQADGLTNRELANYYAEGHALYLAYLADAPSSVSTTDAALGYQFHRCRRAAPRTFKCKVETAKRAGGEGTPTFVTVWRVTVKFRRDQHTIRDRVLTYRLATPTDTFIASLRGAA